MCTVEKMNYFYILLLINYIHAQIYNNNKANLVQICPDIYLHTFRGYVPRGNTSAGTFRESSAKSLKACVSECCMATQCNVAFMTDNKCYHIECASNDVCLPAASTNIDSNLRMVLVRPTLGSETWTELIESQDFQQQHENYNMDRFEDAYRDLLQMSESNYDDATSCTIGVQLCPPNEECVRNYPKSRAGTCKCKDGFVRNGNGVCYLIGNVAEGGELEAASTGNEVNATSPASKKLLIVTAESKQIKLPNNEVSLKAFVSPPPTDGEKYNYEWTSLHKPDGSNAVKQHNADVLQLTKLSEGLYTFKVNVSSENGYGETFVNVTVLPPSRINKPPQIIITPANQTIKLPNTGAVLDASSTTDDDGIIGYHWDLQQGPIGYQPKLADTQTLQLNDLTRPGNYTFKLTVTDSDKATSTAIANITVLKVTDYPPEANAGEDKIIYLPHNQITLNGNLSTDDHTIATWEWTKSDANKAVDMQDTRTPYLKLTDLEEGIYTFQLKVTDSANQSSVANVHVFVKPPTNQPPVARVSSEGNLTISLPQTWVVVDASNSSDDNKIIAFRWGKLDGPSNVVFINPNASRTNVTGLTKGTYAFNVSVTDNNNNVATAIQYVIVNQNKNQKPKANAGGDLQVELPRNVIYVNGSKSSDDWAIVKWKWIRTSDSLAFGRIAEHSDETAILILSDLVPGKYIFNLTVADEQGLSDTDTVHITIKNDPKMYYLLDMIVTTNYQTFTNMEYETLKGKLALLVQDSTKLQVRELKRSAEDSKAIIRFYVENAAGVPLNANDVVHHLRDKLKVDASLLGFNVASLQTAICQNNCSGHGVCDEKTRKCICEAFWMPDMFKVYLGTDSDSDCSWSILYVVLGVICGVIAIAGSVWGLIFLCLSRCMCNRRNKSTSYKLIENTEDLPHQYNTRKVDLSDSDTDSDIVFESRNKLSSRYGNESRNGHKVTRNGLSKNRRVKT